MIDFSAARAVLIGNGNFSDARIPDLPSAQTSVAAMERLLTGDLCRWPRNRVTTFVDVPTWPELSRRLLSAVKDVTGPLVFYYVGHGLRTSKGTLALALGETSADPELLAHTSMGYDSVADILRGRAATTKLVILDCCHAELGSKSNYFQFQDVPFGEVYPVEGLYFIGASKAMEKAKSPVTGAPTYFTEAFVDVVRRGVAEPAPELSIQRIFVELRKDLLSRGLPEPVEATARGAYRFPFAVNAGARRAVGVEASDSQPCRIVGPPVAPALATFKNRLHEREALRRHLFNQSTRLVTISGRPGIGKSALAAKVIEEVAGGEWPDDVAVPARRGVVNASTRIAGITLERLYFDIAKLTDADVERGLLATWASGLTLSEKLVQLLDSLAGGWYVVLLDNIDDLLADDGTLYDEDLQLFINHVIRFGQALRLLVTTRVPIALPVWMLRHEARLTLDNGLPVDDAVELLLEIDRNDLGGVSDLPHTELQRAVLAVHGIPRALELLVGGLMDNAVTSLSELLESFLRRDEVVPNLALERYNRLSEPDRTVLDAISVLGRPATTDLVAWMVAPAMPYSDAQQTLGVLVKVQMLSADRQHKTYALHPLDADIALKRLVSDHPDDAQRLHRRAADWYLAHATGRSRWKIVDDVGYQRASIQHRLQADDIDAAARELAAIDDFMVWRGSATEVVSLHERLRGRIGDTETTIRHLIGYGTARMVVGPVSDVATLMEEARALAVGGTDPGLEERVNFLLGDAFRTMHRYDEAEEAMKRSAALAHGLGDWEREAHALLFVSLIQGDKGDLAQALATTDSLETLAIRTDEPLVHARLGDARSAVFVRARRWAETIEVGTAGIAWYQRSGVIDGIGFIRSNQGVAALGLGRIPDALRYFSLGFEDGMSSGYTRAMGLCAYNQAWAHWMEGDFEGAKLSAAQSAASYASCAGADTETARFLLTAATAAAETRFQDAADALRESARSRNRNINFFPADWMIAEADRLSQAGGSRRTRPGRMWVRRFRRPR